MNLLSLEYLRILEQVSLESEMKSNMRLMMICSTLQQEGITTYVIKCSEVYVPIISNISSHSVIDVQYYFDIISSSLKIAIFMMRSEVEIQRSENKQQLKPEVSYEKATVKAKLFTSSQFHNLHKDPTTRQYSYLLYSTSKLLSEIFCLLLLQHKMPFRKVSDLSPCD